MVEDDDPLRSVVVPMVLISAARLAPSCLTDLRPPALLPQPFPTEALLRLVAGPAEELAPPPA